MTRFESCGTCEFRDTPHTCYARVSGHRAFCGDPKYRDHLRRMTTGEPSPPGPEAPGPPPPSPGPLAMAASFVGAAVDHALDGGRLASPEVRAVREAACFACPLHVEPDGCKACGCGVNPALSFVGLDLEVKRSWASSRCPDDPPRWDTA